MPFTDMIYTTALILVAFLGIFAGYFLSLIAPEEIKEGYKYFVIMQNTLFSILIAVIAFYFTGMITGSALISIAVSLILAVLAFALLYSKNFVGALYVFLGITLYTVRDRTEYLIIISCLIYFIGITAASMLAYDYVKDEKIQHPKKYLAALLVRYVWFIPAAFLPFIFSYF
jgi:hypothetical protein